LIRSGIEILSALPKLYWNDSDKHRTEWLKFTKKKLPEDRLWISLDALDRWTAIAEWSGIQMTDIIELCDPFPNARHVVFRSYQQHQGIDFYEVLNLEVLKHPQTILAYEMNGYRTWQSNKAEM
jgi:DMSO/TMAO reductase YedYZ molybdopterin-dependent catalytic subunit